MTDEAQQLPKYKVAGLITAHTATGSPTAHAAQFAVAWVTGLAFRNPQGHGITAALCITPHGKDPKYAGLHLAPDAARELVTQLRAEAAKAGGCVDVDNHRDGAPQVWGRFADEDAVLLAQAVDTAVAGH